MRNRINKTEKLKQISSGEVIFTVESKFKKPSRAYAFFLRGMIALLAIGIIAAGTTMHNSVALFIAVFVAAVMSIAFLKGLSLSLSRGNPLIITTEGIAVEPHLCERWEDIDNYAFEKFETITGKILGTTLRLFNKGLTQRTIGIRGPSHFRILGYLFNAEQQQKLEGVFTSHGIKAKW